MKNINKDKAVGYDLDPNKLDNHRFIHPFTGWAKFIKERKKAKEDKKRK